MNQDNREKWLNLGFRLIVLALAAVWIAFPPQRAQPAETPYELSGLTTR